MWTGKWKFWSITAKNILAPVLYYNGKWKQLHKYNTRKEGKMRIININPEVTKNLVIEPKIYKENPLSDEIIRAWSISASILRAQEI